MEHSCLSVEQLRAYAKGEISKDESYSIERHLIDCEICTDIVEGLMVDIDEANVQKQTENINERIWQYVNRHTRSNWRTFIIYAAAAMLLVAGAIFFFPTTDSGNVELFAAYYTPYPSDVPIVRGESRERELEAAMAYYVAEDYYAALAALEQLLEAEPDDPLLRFYTGVAELNIERFQAAIANLEAVSRQTESSYAEHAEWYLGLTYLRQNDIPQARTIFEKLRQSNSLYANKSTELLEALEAL